jgi:hypothetical protein
MFLSNNEVEIGNTECRMRHTEVVSTAVLLPRSGSVVVEATEAALVISPACVSLRGFRVPTHLTSFSIGGQDHRRGVGCLKPPAESAQFSPGVDTSRGLGDD